MDNLELIMRLRRLERKIGEIITRMDRIEAALTSTGYGAYGDKNERKQSNT